MDEPREVGAAVAADSAAVWDRGLRELASRCASDLGIPLERGVYAGVTGPSLRQSPLNGSPSVALPSPWT